MSSHLRLPVRRQPAGAGRRGFTLIELMVVIVILGLLITLVVGNPFRALAKSENDTAFNQMVLIKDAIDMYRTEYHSIPKSLNDLTQEDPRTKQAFLENIPSDPWGGAYDYRITDDRRGRYELSSAGADKQMGTDDDIYYPRRDAEK